MEIVFLLFNMVAGMLVMMLKAACIGAGLVAGGGTALRLMDRFLANR